MPEWVTSEPISTNSGNTARFEAAATSEVVCVMMPIAARGPFSTSMPPAPIRAMAKAIGSLRKINTSNSPMHRMPTVTSVRPGRP